jgi:quercetin dioxygenase-like cupin family protein
LRSTLRIVVVLSLFATAAVLAQAPAPSAPKPPGMEESQVVNLKDVKWVAAKPPIPTGVMVAPIAADAPPGGSIGYAKYAPGLQFPEHWHSAPEYTTIISGTVRYTVEGKSSELGPGGYIVIPAKAKHSVVCLPGSECIAMTRRSGPTDYNWVK